MRRATRRFAARTLAILLLAGTAWPQLPNCTESFDITCPNTNPQCGATFVSSLPGDRCVTAFLTNCYSSGLRAYRVSPGQTVTINLAGDLFSLDVFFAQSAGGTGTMDFFDMGGQPVGTQLTANGPSNGPLMPPMQRTCFSTAVRKIVVTHTGNTGLLWIDDFEVNPFPASATVRNGTGINNLCYASLNQPVLGSTWNVEVTTSGHPGATLAALVFHTAPAMGLVLSGGEVLVGGVKLFQTFKVPGGGGSAVFSVPVPNDLALIGASAATQAIILGGGWEACNAVDVVLGCL